MSIVDEGFIDERPESENCKKGRNWENMNQIKAEQINISFCSKDYSNCGEYEFRK